MKLLNSQKTATMIQNIFSYLLLQLVGFFFPEKFNLIPLFSFDHFECFVFNRANKPKPPVVR